jgi:hypothetical protein
MFVSFHMLKRKSSLDLFFAYFSYFSKITFCERLDLGLSLFCHIVYICCVHYNFLVMFYFIMKKMKLIKHNLISYAKVHKFGYPN